MGNIKIGINIVSLAYLRPSRNGLFATPQELINIAEDIGLDFVMTLTTRGASGNETPTEFIKFCEGPWNASTIADFLLRRPGTIGTPAQLHDMVLFPNPEECQKLAKSWTDQGIRRIYQQTRSASLVELHPGLDLTPSQLSIGCQVFGYELVVDTRHLQRGYRPDEIKAKPERAGKPSPLGTTLESQLEGMEMLGDYLADVMHFNIDAKDYVPMIRSQAQDKNYEIVRQWKRLTTQYKTRYIVLEFRPSPFDLRENIAFARYLQSYVNLI